MLERDSRNVRTILIKTTMMIMTESQTVKRVSTTMATESWMLLIMMMTMTEYPITLTTMTITMAFPTSKKSDSMVTVMVSQMLPIMMMIMTEYQIIWTMTMTTMASLIVKKHLPLPELRFLRDMVTAIFLTLDLVSNSSSTSKRFQTTM